MKKRENVVLIVIGIILEAIVCAILGGSEAKLTLLIAVISIPIIMILIYVANKSYENTLLFAYFIVPLLPVGGYILLRLEILKYQWIYYIAVYILIGSLLFKNGLKNRFSFKNLKYKEKVIRSLLFILLIISCIFAYNKSTSFMIICLSFIPFSLINMILKGSIFNNKKEFYENILKALSLGAILSAVPDFAYFIISLLNGNNYRLFGPLGANALLAYTLILFILILSKWTNTKGLKNSWTILIVGFSMTISIQQSRGALVCLIFAFIFYIIFDIKNVLKYLSVFLIVGGLVFFNVSIRTDVSNDESVEDFQNAIVGNNEKINRVDNEIEKALFKLIESQSSNRQEIWKAGIQISNDYPLTGIGIGNYKYFFKEYANSNANYSDAHNIFLNMSSEIGTPFMIISLILILWIGFTSVFHYFKKKDQLIKRKYLGVGISIIVFIIFGNFTGVSFQATNEIYTFMPTFMILFFLMYRDYIEEF